MNTCRQEGAQERLADEPGDEANCSWEQAKTLTEFPQVDDEKEAELAAARAALEKE